MRNRSNIGLLLSLFLWAFGFFHSAQAQQSVGDAIMEKGDSIDIYMSVEDFESIKSKSAGAQVTLKMLENEERRGKVLITKQTPVYCTVIERKKPGSFGSAGKLRMQVDSTHSTAGTVIPLDGEIELKGSKKTWAVIVFFIGWAVKGGDIEFPEGENTYKPVVAEETTLQYLR
jgi:hypothetical protein